MSSLNPGLILILGALLVPMMPHALRRWYLLVLPVIGFAHVHGLENGTSVSMDLLGMTFETLRVDGLSRVWGYIFNIAAFLSLLFAWHDKDAMQQTAAPIYAGAAIGAVFAGDLVTLFVYWELTAISSVFLIWASRTQRAYRTGMRYLLIQVGSGVILLSGVLVWFTDTGSIGFGHIGIESLGGQLIFLAFGIKCAFPLLHAWLKDAYPEATVAGAVIMSAFTTKLAIYALARGYAGTEVLIYIGAMMAVFPIFYAVVENDLRRTLSYSLISQLGFMVVGIGVGTELALNGTASHAFSSVLYKGLLFMTMGAVLFRTGTCKASELGGLYKSMPWTAGFCTVGAASVAAFPLFSGFVSKSMIITAVAEQHLWVIWAVLLLASASVLHHTGIKVPYFAFFAKDSGRRVKEAPWNMLLAMGLTAFLCILIGVYPKALYDILPFPASYVPYTAAHVITQLQLLMFSALAFIVLVLYKIYPSMMKSTMLDVDWIYRRALPVLMRGIGRIIGDLDRSIRSEALNVLRDLIDVIERKYGLNSPMSMTIQAGTMALVVAGVLFVLILLLIL